MRILLLATLLAVGCAEADLDAWSPVTKKADSGNAPVADAATYDSGTAKPQEDTSVDEDTATIEPDSAIEMDSAAVDTGTAPSDSGLLFTALVYDDYAGIPSLAPAAVTALGGTTIPCDNTTGLSTFDAGGFDFVIVEAPNLPLQSGLDTRLITWMKGGGRLILSHWQLDLATALTSELGVTVSSYATPRPVYADATSIDFFTGKKETLPSPISGLGTTFGVHGFSLEVASPSFLAGRIDSASGSGVIGVTHGGKVIVNGFLLADFATVDGDGDGKKDTQELLENEIAYALSK